MTSEAVASVSHKVGYTKLGGSHKQPASYCAAWCLCVVPASITDNHTVTENQASRFIQNATITKGMLTVSPQNKDQRHRPITPLHLTQGIDWFRVINQMHLHSLDELRQLIAYDGYRVMVDVSAPITQGTSKAATAPQRIEVVQFMRTLPRHLLCCLLTREPDMQAVEDAVAEAEASGEKLRKGAGTVFGMMWVGDVG